MNDILYGLAKTLGNAVFPIMDIDGKKTRSVLGDYLASGWYRNTENMGKPIPNSQVLGSQAYVAPTATPTPRPINNYTAKITVPSDNPAGEYTFNPQVSQAILGSFDSSGQATKAATLLHHPYGEQIIGYGRGENPQVITGKGWNDYNYNKDGTIKYITNPQGQLEPSEDRGLFRINNATFYGLQQRKPKQMERIGVKSYADMYDANKNAAVAKLILDEGGYGRWFAALLSMLQGGD